jgi:tetratricopeptide (TPR) repeat protein
MPQAPPPTVKRTCYVAMGFGEKVDYGTGRKLNLDASYRNLIKPAVESAGFDCVRADEIAHSGNINVPMYELLLNADLVIADLSAGNGNAFYELGVRHALRPHTTIVISEDQQKVPLDIGMAVVHKYRHLGDDIGVSEVRRFQTELVNAINAIFSKEPREDDSPVYTFLNHLVPPVPGERRVASEAAESESPPAADERVGEMMELVKAARAEGNWKGAVEILESLHQKMPGDAYVTQQLARATYQGKEPDAETSLLKARELLQTLAPETSNDTETLGLWGAVHKRLWELARDRAHLDEAVRGFERAFYLRNDHYNGINLAYLLNVRAAETDDRAEAVADFVEARRTRREVIDICQGVLKDDLSGHDRFWLMATLAEAQLGVGDESAAEQTFDEAASLSTKSWMTDSVREQLDKLRKLLAHSPLKYVRGS